jgi:hypothetical protein
MSHLVISGKKKKYQSPHFLFQFPSPCPDRTSIYSAKTTAPSVPANTPDARNPPFPEAAFVSVGSGAAAVVVALDLGVSISVSPSVHLLDKKERKKRRG